jgi:hypothetical protein
MRKLILFGLMFTTSAFADNCRVTSASIERNGQFENETVTVCKEGFEQVPKIKIGDTILETEVGKSNVKVGYFKHQNAQCRLFSERHSQNGKLAVYHGVICQIDNSPTNWLVVDKW